MSNINDRLLKCFSVVFPELSEEEITRASTNSVANWDSLATVNLLAVSEEEFNIQFTPEDFEYLISFTLILDYLQNRKNG
jgi:acyl carrier protein